MIKTTLGWRRSTHKQRVKQREVLVGLEVAFRCMCNQCYCGGLETVVYKEIPCCKSCGKPKHFSRHTLRSDIPKYYGLDHISFCSKKEGRK